MARTRNGLPGSFYVAAASALAAVGLAAALSSAVGRGTSVVRDGDAPHDARGSLRDSACVAAAAALVAAGVGTAVVGIVSGRADPGAAQSAAVVLWSAACAGTAFLAARHGTLSKLPWRKLSAIAFFAVTGTSLAVALSFLGIMGWASLFRHSPLAAAGLAAIVASMPLAAACPMIRRLSEDDRDEYWTVVAAFVVATTTVVPVLLDIASSVHW